MKKVLLSLSLALALGCATKQPVQAPIPGSVNQVDSNLYQIIRPAHDIAKYLSDHACTNNGNQPGCYNPGPTEKVAVNQFIFDYNIADPIYQAYHNGTALASTGKVPTQSEVESAVNKVAADQASIPSNLKTAAGVK